MNKRDHMLNLVDSPTSPTYVPAAFFLHFGSSFEQGQAAIDRHLAFFRATDMDFVKIQFEQLPIPTTTVRTPADWAHVPLYPEEYFQTTVRIVEGLVNAAKREALVILTLYSPFMWLKHFAPDVDLAAQFQENPAAVQKGLHTMTENVLRLVRACKRAGVDGFYASTQGGEAFRFSGTDIFDKFIKPTDLAVWDEIRSCTFNILHVCDFEGSYDDLTPFLDYPGQVVNCSLKVGDRHMTPIEASRLFGRPFMGGMERKGVIATGSPDEIRRAATSVLQLAPERFILGADCTVPSETPWEHLRVAIDTAHHYHP